MQVNTESQSSIFLSYQHHSTGPWTETPPDCPHLHHLLEVSLHLLIQVGWYSPIPFFQRLGVCNFNVMLQDVAFAQIQIIFGEDISRVNQKVFGCLLLVCCPFKPSKCSWSKTEDPSFPPLGPCLSCSLVEA